MHKIEIEPKYVGDISFSRSDGSKIDQIEHIVPKTLEKEHS